MDDKSSNDTNNNEALRLANHSSDEHHHPVTPFTASPSSNAYSLDNANANATIFGRKQNGGNTSDSQDSSHENTEGDDDDEPKKDNIDVPEFSSPPPDGSTAAGTSRNSSSHDGVCDNKVNWCKLCGKKCRKPGDFQRHLVQHLGRKPFKCADCDKRFQVKSNMLLHQRAAHGDRYNHEFLECPAGVSSSTNMPVLCPERFGDGPLSLSLPHKKAPGDAKPERSPQQQHRDNNNDDNGADMNERNKPEDSPGSSKGQGHGSSSPASGHSEGSPGELDHPDDDYSVEYPSVFPGLKQQLQVRNETVLVTRLDGLNKITKERLSLFKCHMCGKIFNFLSKLQCHLSMHFERTLNVFVCMYCDAHFRFKTQLTQHLRRSHEVDVTTKDDILDMSEMLPEGEGGVSPSDDRGPKGSNGGSKPDYSGFPTGGSSQVASGKQNSGSLPDGDVTSGPGTAGTNPSSPAQNDDEDYDNNMHYSMATGALYSRVNGLYICQFCNKGFDRMFSLSRHERVHTGFKPCYCKYCGRGFSEPRNLRHHIIRFHAEGSQGHIYKRYRKGSLYGNPWRVNRRVSHSTQRLAYIPPELVARSHPHDDQKHKSVGGDQMTSAESPTDRRSTTPPTDLSMNKHQDHERRDADTRSDVTEPPHEPIVIQPMGQMTSGSASNNELANEIREKEQLDEDICVVIPSGPLDGSKDQERHTPKSTCSDNTNWSETVSETESTNNDVIMSAPIKSLIGHHGQLKSRRKMSFTATTPTHGEERQLLYSTPPEDDDIKPKMEPPSDLPTTSLSSVYPSLDNPLNSAVSAALTLPFNPLNISTYMSSGLGGLLPSPLISPLNQAAFFAQQGLTSPSMMSNPLSFFSPVPSPAGMNTSLIPTMSTATPTTTPKESLSPMDQSLSPGQKVHSPSGSDPNPPPRGSLDDLQSWMSKGGGRGSALSRSHSSRLYVVRQPVKREDACKPVVLPDGRTVYRCTYCNKDFCTFSDVNRHMDFHEGGFGMRDNRHGPRHAPRDSPAFLQDIRPYKCKFCDYYARTNSQLKVHMMRHQGIREFHCKLCNYKGVTQSDLNRHMKSQIHMMKAQNECKHCGEGFVSPKNLERHYHEKHFSQYEKMASSHAAAAAHAAAHAGKLTQGPGFQGNA